MLEAKSCNFGSPVPTLQLQCSCRQVAYSVAGGHLSSSTAEVPIHSTLFMSLINNGSRCQVRVSRCALYICTLLATMVCTWRPVNQVLHYIYPRIPTPPASLGIQVCVPGTPNPPLTQASTPEVSQPSLHTKITLEVFLYCLVLGLPFVLVCTTFFRFLAAENWKQVGKAACVGCEITKL